MDWVAIIQTTLASSSIIAVVLLILGFIANRLFSQILSKDIENYKINLQKEVDLLKVNLEKTSIEHQIRFESLHAERAKIIAELYRLLAETQKETTEMMISLGAIDDPFFEGVDIKARESREELNDYFSQNRIYFTDSLCNKISQFIDDLYKAYRDYKKARDSVEKKQGIPLDAIKVAIDEIPEIKKEIEKEFRLLIGIESGE